MTSLVRAIKKRARVSLEGPPALYDTANVDADRDDGYQDQDVDDPECTVAGRHAGRDAGEIEGE